MPKVQQLPCDAAGGRGRALSCTAGLFPPLGQCPGGHAAGPLCFSVFPLKQFPCLCAHCILGLFAVPEMQWSVQRGQAHTIIPSTGIGHCVYCILRLFAVPEVQQSVQQGASSHGHPRGGHSSHRQQQGLQVHGGYRG